MSDPAGHGAQQLDAGEVRHTMTIYDVEHELERAGVGRSHRQVIRYCETGMLDAVKVPGPTGDQWFVSPASVPKTIADLKQWDTQRAGRAAPGHAMSEHVAIEKSSKLDNVTARQSVPEPAVSEKKTVVAEVVTEPAAPRQSMPDLDIFEHPYVKRLEDRCEKLETKFDAQVRRTEEIQQAHQKELIELQRMTAVGNSQTLADFMLKAKDWMLSPGRDAKKEESGEPQQTQS